MLLLLSTPKNQYFHSVSLFNYSTACIRTFQTSLLYSVFSRSHRCCSLLVYIWLCKKVRAGCRCTVAQAVLLTFRNKQEWRGGTGWRGVGAENRVYAQSGNGDFLAYIPSWWKNLPSLVRVGDARPPLWLYLRAKLWFTLQQRRQKHSPYFSSIPICTLWGGARCWVWNGKERERDQREER